MSTFSPRKAGGRPSGRDFKVSGSKDFVFNKSGEINAYDKKDLMKSIAHVMMAASNGDIDLDAPSEDGNQPTELTAAEKLQAFQEAYHDKTSPVFAKMGEKIAADVNLSVDRVGFMRTLLEKNEIQGRVAQIRTRVNQVTAVYMTTTSNLEPQFNNSKWFTVPEFNIETNVWVSGDDITMDGEQILQDQYDYSLQAFLTGEDRSWKKMADSVVGISYPLQVFGGDFTPDDFIGMQQLLTTGGVPATTVLMHYVYWQYFLNNASFANWFDPATRYEMLHTGNVGSLLGLNFITDGFREANLRVIEPGEIYMVGPPEMHGGYTERGPINAIAVDGYNEGLDARGWFMKERLSMAIVNPASIVKGRRAV